MAATAEITGEFGQIDVAVGASAQADSQAGLAFGQAQDQLAAGAISALDLLTAEQTLISADAALAASDATLVQDQIGLFKALGGGWK